MPSSKDSCHHLMNCRYSVSLCHCFRRHLLNNHYIELLKQSLFWAVFSPAVFISVFCRCVNTAIHSPFTISPPPPSQNLLIRRITNEPFASQGISLPAADSATHSAPSALRNATEWASLLTTQPLFSGFFFLLGKHSLDRLLIFCERLC